MAPALRRSQRKTAAIAIVVCLTALSGPVSRTYATIGGSARASPGRRSRTTAGDSRVMPTPHMTVPFSNPLPWSEDLEGLEAKQRAETAVAAAVTATDGRLKMLGPEMTKKMAVAELRAYDRQLNAKIAELEDKISIMQQEILRDAMAVSSKPQLAWLEGMLNHVEELRGELAHVREAESELHSRLEREDGFLQQLVRAAAVALGGHKAAMEGSYPATGVSSYTGQPSAVF
eukprot:TRINITY_DN50051_c0_g1_i1.p1 TRINITY_DN50051_c0_g1~~TRINITY_DN50051_c0_g1_i1.p1  ORF type:complete len:231 (-),score=69.46 TRINITY_DN50051_c0_g1_i1:332-1024(-)